MICGFNEHSKGVNCVKFHPDGTVVAACGDDEKINIWDIRSQRAIQRYDLHEYAPDAPESNEKKSNASNQNTTSSLAEVKSISFHRGGSYLVSSSANSPIKIWDLRKGCILYTLYGHVGSTNTCQFSPSGDYFSTGGNDSVVMIWKSNLNELEREVIDDFGGKTTVLPSAVADTNNAKNQAKAAAKARPQTANAANKS
jgi:centriolar protein POC1